MNRMTGPMMPYSGWAAAAAAKHVTNSGSTTVSLFSKTTKSAPCFMAYFIPMLLPPAHPPFVVDRIKCAHGNSAFNASVTSTCEALSTTIVWAAVD